MIKSGITRRIDELGRIVVPKEIRYNLGIRDGEPLEIYTSDNAIIIKKYSQVENIKDIGENLCNIFYDICNVGVLISDREKIIATSSNLKSVSNMSLNDKYKNLIDNRESYNSETMENNFNLNGYFNIIPIITSIDCSGLVMIISNKKDDNNIKLAKIITKLIVNKIDVN